MAGQLAGQVAFVSGAARGQGRNHALALARAWWAQGADLVLETRGVNLKKALTTANRMGRPLALILGEGERERGVVAVKDLAAGTQEDWALEDVPARLAR